MAKNPTSSSFSPHATPAVMQTEQRWLQFCQWLKDSQSNEPEVRTDALRRLSLLNRREVGRYLPRYWAKRCRSLSYYHHFLVFCMCMMSVVALITLLQSKSSLTSSMLILSGVINIILWQVGTRTPIGAIYMLTQHPFVEFVPLMVEALRHLDYSQETHQQYRWEIRRALARLLPRFVQSDFPPLTSEQRSILRTELRAYSIRLQDAYSTLSPEEANYIRAILEVLHPQHTPCAQQEIRRLEKTLLELAEEKWDAPHEPQARQQVRESARQFLIQISH